jgi:ABC-type amino acid transport substrate-binding protein
MIRITGTYHLSKAGFEIEPIRALIQRRRHQVLIHSCIYYRFNQSLVTDEQWNSWAQELVKLQKQHPKVSQSVGYHKYFVDFDSSTGYDLPIARPEIMRKAQLLLRKGGTPIGTNTRVSIDFSKLKKVHRRKRG